MFADVKEGKTIPTVVRRRLADKVFGRSKTSLVKIDAPSHGLYI